MFRLNILYIHEGMGFRVDRSVSGISLTWSRTPKRIAGIINLSFGLLSFVGQQYILLPVIQRQPSFNFQSRILNTKEKEKEFNSIV